MQNKKSVQPFDFDKFGIHHLKKLIRHFCSPGFLIEFVRHTTGHSVTFEPCPIQDQA